MTVDPHLFISSPPLCTQSKELFYDWPLPVGAAKEVWFTGPPEHTGGELGQIQPISRSLNPSEHHTHTHTGTHNAPQTITVKPVPRP